MIYVFKSKFIIILLENPPTSLFKDLIEVVDDFLFDYKRIRSSISFVFSLFETNLLSSKRWYIMHISDFNYRKRPYRNNFGYDLIKILKSFSS